MGKMILTDGLCGTDSTTWSWLTDGTGRYAGNRSLKYFNASLPNLTIGTEMFKGCTALSAVEKGGPGTMTALNNATSMFEESGIVYGGVIPIQGGNATAMYKNCKNLKRFFADGIKSVNCDSMLEGCSNLNYMSIAIGTGETATITSAIKMFKDCTSLHNIEMYIPGSGPPFRVEITGSSESMFEGCTELTSFPPSGAHVTNMTNCKNMFAGCIKLSTIHTEGYPNGVLVGMSGAQITNAEGMFKGCIKLTGDAPSGFDKIVTADSMFEGCVSLTSAGNPHGDYSRKYAFNLVSANNMFAGCTSMIDAAYDLDATDAFSGDNAKLVKAKGMFGNNELGWCKLSFGSALHIARSITNLTGKTSDGTEEWGKISIGVAKELKDYKVPGTGKPSEDPETPEEATWKTFEELLLNGDTEYTQRPGYNEATTPYENFVNPDGSETYIQRISMARGLLTKGWTVELHYDGDDITTTHEPTPAG